MSEPASSSVAGVAIATGAITLTGSVFGLQYDALLCGLFGGLIALMHLEISSRWNMAFSLGSSALLAGMFSPVAVAGSLNYVDWLQTVHPTALRMAAAGAIGLFGQVLIPIVMAFLRRKGSEA